MLAVPFTALTSTDDSIAINDLLQGNFAAGDTIQIFDGISSYTTLTYRTTSTLNGKNMGPAWCEGRSNYSTIELAAGDCFWINTKATVTLIGKVSSTKALALDANSLHMIANTQPVDVAINDITFEGVSAGDTIQIFDGLARIHTISKVLIRNPFRVVVGIIQTINQHSLGQCCRRVRIILQRICKIRLCVPFRQHLRHAIFKVSRIF